MGRVGMHVTNIILYGKSIDNTLEKTLIEALASYGGVEFICSGKVSGHSFCRTPRFILYHSSFPLEIQLKRCIVIFGSDVPPESIPQLSEESVCIVESGNRMALSLLQNSGRTVLCCGMSSRDTLSVSSLAPANGVVSLQRQMITLNGRTIEPGDIPVSFSNPTDAFPLAASTASLILAGIPCENGFRF